MYKTRGRPEDPWNLEAATIEKSIAESIHIRPLKNTNTINNDNKNILIGIRDENARRRHHFEEFRETYQQRFQRAKEDAQMKKVKMKQDLDEYMIRTRAQLPDNTAAIATQTSMYNYFTSTNYKQLPGHPVRTVSVDAPNPRKTHAITIPPSQNFIDHKLKALPKKNVHTQNKSVIMKQLAETQDQINEANDQLEQIQSLLKHKQVQINDEDSLAAIQRDYKPIHDLYKKNPFARYTLLQSSDPRVIQPTEYKGEIGTPFPSGPNFHKKSTKQETPIRATKLDFKEAKKNKIKQTLKDVNQMIQKMQDKYFSKSHPRYKSLTDYDKEHSPVSVLFENGHFPTGESDKSCDYGSDKFKIFTPHVSSQSQKYQLINSADISYETCTTSDSHPSIGSKMEKINQDSSSVSMILSPKEECDLSKGNKKKPSCCVNFGTSRQDNDDSYYDLSDKIKESVSSSEYLAREFSIDDFKSKSSSCSRKKSVHFSSTDAPNVDSYANRKKEQLNSFIKSALKDSLYKT